jgi:HK97 family phage portal protein
MSLFFGRRDEARAMDWWSRDSVPSGRRVVSEASATTLGPVFSAIRHIVDFGSTPPIKSYREMSDGTRAPAPLPLLLRRQDAPGFPGIQSWIGQALYGIAVHGNAVGWIMDTDGYGYPTDVHWLRRQDWQYDMANRQWLAFGAPVPASQLLHIPWIVPSGHVVGLSPIEHAASVIAAGLSAQEYSDPKRGGGIPPTILKNNRLELDPTVAAEVRERAITAFMSGRPFVTGSDWDLTIPTIPPNHAKFIEILQLSANQIAAMYGIDPREVGGSATESMTYVNDEARTLNRAANIRPYIERLEDAFSRHLPSQQCIEFDVDSTIRTDIKTQTEVLGWQIADGRLSVNEARAIKNLPPVPGGDRHNFLTPMSLTQKPSLEPTREDNEGEHHERR